MNLTNMIIDLFPETIILLSGENHHKNYVRQLNPDFNHQIINIIGKLSISEIIYLISRSALFIGNDSGLFHIAKALDIPRVGIIGGGSFNLIHPYNNITNEKLIFSPQDCFGCNWNCTKGEPYCLTRVEEADVLTAVKDLLTVD